MTIDVEQELTLDERTMVDFTLGLRQRWSGTVYPALAGQYAESGGAPLPELPLYPWFSHLERAQQKLLWWAVSDAVLARADRLASAAASEPGGPATLELDEHLVLPEWYTAYDIHMQPGGVWGDDLSAYVYELGARIVMLRSNDGYQFHQLFAAGALPDLPGARRVVDVGCGFGKSTRPLVARYPGAEVVGVDLAAPNLRLAYAQATAADLPVRFRQADARSTGLEPGSADLVTGTMVLHEMPAGAVRETLAEAARLMRPGGAVRFLEFGRTGDHCGTRPSTSTPSATTSRSCGSCWTRMGRCWPGAGSWGCGRRPGCRSTSAAPGCVRTATRPGPSGTSRGRC